MQHLPSLASEASLQASGGGAGPVGRSSRPFETNQKLAGSIPGPN